MGEDTLDEFEDFVARIEPRLRRALGAAYGPMIGRDAAVDALSWAWQNWDRVSPMTNPVGYLYRVGQTSARRHFRSHRRDAAVTLAVERDGGTPQPVGEFEPVPELGPALGSLSPRQRTAVVLVHGYGLPLREVADTMNVSVATVRQHVERGLRRLRTDMEVDNAV